MSRLRLAGRRPRMTGPRSALFPFFRLEWAGPPLTGGQVADLWTIDAYGAPFGVSKRQEAALTAKGLVVRVRESECYARLTLTAVGKLAVEAGQRQAARIAMGQKCEHPSDWQTKVADGTTVCGVCLWRR